MNFLKYINIFLFSIAGYMLITYPYPIEIKMFFGGIICLLYYFNSDDDNE